MIFINLVGLLLIAIIIWWFWIFKTRAVTLDSGVTTIRVENGVYSPSRIQLIAGEESTLQFLRIDESSCAQTVVFADLDISAELILNQNTEVHLPPLKAGTYPFACQMQMYRGEVVVGE